MDLVNGLFDLRTEMIIKMFNSDNSIGRFVKHFKHRNLNVKILVIIRSVVMRDDTLGQQAMQRLIK